MTEPPKPKRKVTGQITFSSSATTTTTSNPSTPSHLPRARAKVDVSNLPSPATNTRPGLPQSYSSSGSTTTTGRPALRNTTSSASLRSTTSTGSRARSPAHPLPSPSLNQNAARGTPTTSASTNARPTFRPSTSQTSTPVFRRAASSGRTSPVKESTARIRASAVTQNVFSGRSPQVNGGTGRGGEQDNIYSTPTTASGQGFFKRPSDVEPKLRARVTPTQAISTSPERYPPLLSPDSALDQPQSWRSQAQSYPSPFQSDTGVYGDRPRPSPTSVVSPTVAQHAIMSQIPLHPTASAPGSPHHPSTPLSLQRSVSIKSTARRMLPYNPTTQVPRLPTTPLSPEMRTVDLPMMTPTRTRSREDPIRRPSLLGSGTGRVDDGGLLNFDGPERTSDDTVVGSSGDQDKSIEGEQDISEIDILLDTEDDVVEARVNRKIADLEITNASLLAINRSLEATKSKQRSEILKLRRMLRESIHGPLPGLPTPLPAYLTSPNPDEEDDLDEEDMRDPELDARWDKVAEMVENMNKKAVVAVEKVKEEVKAAGRVLDWTEVEGLNSSVGSLAGTPEPERVTT